MSGAGGHPPPEGAGDDFFEQLLSTPLYGGGTAGAEEGNRGGVLPDHGSGLGGQVASSFFRGGVEDGGHPNPEDRGPGSGGDRFLEAAAAARRASFAKTIFDGQSASGSMDVVPYPLAPGPRVRAKRGQATNPHSIAERLRRERIAERMRALQELVPKSNKTDRAAMLDEIVDYVKFLRLQVKVLSMSRHGGTGASSQLADDSPQPQLEGDMSEDGSNCHVWGRWSVGVSTEQQVAKLMEEDLGAAMQFLQSNALCVMPISLAASICRMHNQPGSPSTVKADPGASS